MMRCGDSMSLFIDGLYIFLLLHKYIYIVYIFRYCFWFDLFLENNVTKKLVG